MRKPPPSSRRPPLWGFILALALLLANSAALYFEHRATRRASELASHTLTALNDTQRVLRRLADAESNERGYLITGAGQFLAPYEQAVAAVRRNLKTLIARTEDNPNQQRRLARLGPLIDEKLAQLRDAIAVYDRSGPQAAAPMVRANFAKATMQRIDNLVEKVNREEQQLLTERRATLEALAERVSLLITIGSLLAVGLVVIG